MSYYDDEEFFEAYSKMPRSKDGLSSAGEWYQLKDFFPDLKAKKILDLGCGYGWHCKYAAEQGALSILGIDASEKMIQKAQQINSDPKINYQVCEIDEYDYPEKSYDVVVSNLVLHYLEDLDEVYKKVYWTLKENGVFIFNIEHPIYTSGVKQDWCFDESGNIKHWPIDHYYYPGIRETNFLGYPVMKYHHTLTQILNGLITCGFQIERIEEVKPSKEMLHLPGMKDEMRRPMMLLVKAKK